jgi:hypothetical protein
VGGGESAADETKSENLVFADAADPSKIDSSSATEMPCSITSQTIYFAPGTLTVHEHGLPGTSQYPLKANTPLPSSISPKDSVIKVSPADVQ